MFYSLGIHAKARYTLDQSFFSQTVDKWNVSLMDGKKTWHYPKERVLEHCNLRYLGSNGIIQRLAQVVRQAVQVRTIIVVLQSSCWRMASMHLGHTPNFWASWWSHEWGGLLMRMNGIRYPFDLFRCSSICVIFMGEDRNMQRLHLFCSYHVPYRYRYSCPSCNNTRNKPSFTYPQLADQGMLTTRCAWGEWSELGREYTFALLLPVRLARLVMAGCKHEKTGNSSFHSCYLSKYVESCGHDSGRHFFRWTWGTTSSIFRTISSLMALTYLGLSSMIPDTLIHWRSDFLSRHLSLDCLDFLFSWHLYAFIILLYCMYTLYLEVFRVLISVGGSSPGLNDLYLTVHNSEDRHGAWNEQFAHQAG